MTGSTMMNSRKGKFSLIRSLRNGVAISAMAIMGMLAVSVPSAFAAYTHAAVERTFKVGGNECMSIQDLVVLESKDLIYLSCRVGVYPNEADEIFRYNLDGTPAVFGGHAPYISGNKLIGDPGSEDGKFDYRPDLAVDNSSSPNHGKLFVTSSPNVDIFNESGEWVGDVEQPLETTIPNVLNGIDVGPDGSIYVTSNLPGPGRVSKYNTALQEVRRAYPESKSFYSYTRLRVDSNGAFWFDPWTFGGGSGGGQLRKYEANQFTEELKPKFGTPVPERDYAVPSPYASNPVLNGVDAISVDLNTNDVYADLGNKVDVYSEGTEAEHSYPDSPSFGEGLLKESNAIAVTRDNHVYVGTAGSGEPEIVEFGPGQIVPNIQTSETNIEEVGHHEATVHGKVKLAGGADITGCRVEYGTTTSYSSGSVPCSPNPAASPPGSNFSSDTSVSAELTGLTTGTSYHYRFVAENEHGENAGIDRTVVPAYVLKLQTLAATNVDAHGASLNASFDPDGEETEYYFQYGLSTQYGLETETKSVPASSGVAPVSTMVASLPTGKVFHYRVVARNKQGTTIGPDRTFRTASTPDVEGVRATEVTAYSAVLRAQINPDGYDTTYYFEYGSTAEYGQLIPAQPADIGEGSEPVAISQTITGLNPGFTYHFRVIAENQWGSNVSSDTTLNYTPPNCPNNHVRQETGSSYLPDCRAYELVSPTSSGSVVLYPGSHVFEKSSTYENPYGKGIDYPLNQGYAASPSRFTFYGGLSTPPGLRAPVGQTDMYMSTRTNSGWVVSIPGLGETEAYETGRKQCSEAMDLCIDHSETNEAGYHDESAPYLFTAGGQKKGRLPTNVSLIPGGKTFAGEQTMSEDFNHFVFSSNSTNAGSFGGGAEVPAAVFAPGGLTSGLGSAYDNNVHTREVKIISVLPNGEPLPLEVPRKLTEKGIDFRGVSSDGSHILMETPAGGGLSHLFMRVSDLITYEIAPGVAVEPIGMTRDGKKVFFTTAARLLPEDTDSSIDLYMWRENGTSTGEYTLISQGDGHGNSDECNDSWGPSGCGVMPLTPEQAHPNENTAVDIKGMDDLFAEDSGDIYFYSPEVLDGNRPGVKNERNLYVYRNGQVKLVATLEAGTEVTRMQISPDGAHAALRTASRLTTYDSRGYQEIYTYNPETEVIRCASCNPTGAPPTANVEASWNGRFMADDGRTFFATPDSLEPRDQDGHMMDVYEYVEGRPQLITSGQASRDFTGGSEVLSLFSVSAYTGLEGVSHNGVDVFFSTFETLVKRDHNGEYVKFYDARTGGGFPEEPELLPCAAADECHGAGSATPAPPAINSDGNLGASGNVTAAATHHKQSGRHVKRKRHHRRHRQKRSAAKRRRVNAKRHAAGGAHRATERNHG